MCDFRLKTPAFSAKWDEQMSVNYVFAAGINYAGLFAGHDERRRAPAPDRKSVTKLYRYLPMPNLPERTQFWLTACDPHTKTGAPKSAGTHRPGLMAAVGGASN
jgi:hypothetical protein